MAKVLWCMAETETGVLPFISNNFGDGPGQCGAKQRPGWCLRAQEEPLLSVQGWRSRVPHQTPVVGQQGCVAENSDQQRACCISIT